MRGVSGPFSTPILPLPRLHLFLRQTATRLWGQNPGQRIPSSLAFFKSLFLFDLKKTLKVLTWFCNAKVTAFIFLRRCHVEESDLLHLCTTQYQHERGCLLRLKGAGTTSYPSSSGYIMSLFPSSPLWGAQRISHRHRGVFPCRSALSEKPVMVIFLSCVDDQVDPPGGEGLGGGGKAAYLPPSTRTTPVYPRDPISISTRLDDRVAYR